MKRTLALVLLVVLAIASFGSVFVIDETEQAIVTQFGQPVGEPHTTPGMNFKVPFIQKVHRFDKRFLEWDGERTQLPTRNKRFIEVDTYARWRISDPLLFFQRLRDLRGARTRLDDILDGETRNAVANHDLVEVVRSSNRESAKDESLPKDLDTGLVEIKGGREAIRLEILTSAQSRTQDLGIEILDVRLKRIDYVSEVERKVYDRMKAERQRIATRYRSEGEGEAARIQGEMQRELKRITSEAYREAQSIVGGADAKAIKIFADAYDRSDDTREFYEFLKTMETYENTIDSDTIILLSTEGDFYRFLKGSEGGRGR